MLERLLVAVLSTAIFLVSSGTARAQESVPVNQSLSASDSPVVVTRLLTAVHSRVDWWTCPSFRNNTAQPIV
jgi:hypothetical protein